MLGSCPELVQKANYMFLVQRAATQATAAGWTWPLIRQVYSINVQKFLSQKATRWRNKRFVVQNNCTASTHLCFLRLGRAAHAAAWSQWTTLAWCTVIVLGLLFLKQVPASDAIPGWDWSKDCRLTSTKTRDEERITLMKSRDRRPLDFIKVFFSSSSSQTK